MHTVKIESNKDNKYRTYVYIDGIKISHIVTGFSVDMEAGGLGRFSFDINGIPENIELETEDITFIQHPGSVQDSIKILRQQLLTDTELYQAFVSSIKSALDEMIPFGETEDNAKFILDRIIGREMQDEGFSRKSV